MWGAGEFQRGSQVLVGGNDNWQVSVKLWSDLNEGELGSGLSVACQGLCITWAEVSLVGNGLGSDKS